LHAALFPPNGLDRSLHAPVLVGLIVLTFFAETLGWTYAGLVVPGYLATVFVAAPITGALIVFESILTYGLAAALGRWLPYSGAWSQTFGRERFFLFIVTAVLVRLAVEGTLVPWLVAEHGLGHGRELYSLGLVVVPLLANSYWNSGFRIVAPRLVVVTGLTWAFVEFVLVRHTNFTVSRFQIANESVSLQFLESPHAHVILLLGAMIAARSNVRYGWDYNGILVPALLSVAWYQPTKLATTIVEALAVYGLSRLLASVPPFSRLLLVGPRRTLFAFSVGFGLKMVAGFALGELWPAIQMIDYFGFGYLLPTLLALKMWNKDRIGIVLMPTLQVSLTAFLVGNAAAYGLALVGGLPLPTIGHQPARVGVGRPAAVELMLGDSAPASRARPADPSPFADPSRVALELARDVAARGSASRSTTRLAARASLRLRTDRAWLVLSPDCQDPERELRAPRLAVRAGRPGWLVVAAPAAVGSPVSAVAVRVAERIGARAVLLRSRTAALRPLDEAFAEKLAEERLARRVLRVEEVPSGALALRVVGRVPEGLDVQGLGRALGGPIEIAWRASVGRSRWRFDDAPVLEVPLAAAERIGAEVLGAPPVLSWEGPLRRAFVGRLGELTQVGPAGYTVPRVEELRVFGRALAPALFALAQRPAPSAWDRALAGTIGYRFVEVDAGAGRAWGLVEPGAPRRRGNGSLFVRAGTPRTDPELAVECSTVGWEIGTASAATALWDALDARALFVTGARPNDHPLGAADVRRFSGRRAFFESVHEAWVGRGHRVLSVQGIAPDNLSPDDVVLSLGREVEDLASAPGWASRAVAPLVLAGLPVATFDGARARVRFKGVWSVAMAHAMRFAGDQMAIVWLSPRVRVRFVRADFDHETWARLERAGVLPESVDLATFAARAARGARAPCDLALAMAPFERYLRSRNPFDLRDGLAANPDRCPVAVVRDRLTALAWAVAAAPGRVRLQPIVGSAAGGAVVRLRSAVDLGPASALGIVGLEIEVHP
jgi:hypothetical protein